MFYLCTMLYDAVWCISKNASPGWCCHCGALAPGTMFRRCFRPVTGMSPGDPHKILPKIWSNSISMNSDPGIPWNSWIYWYIRIVHIDISIIFHYYPYISILICPNRPRWYSPPSPRHHQRWQWAWPNPACDLPESTDVSMCPGSIIYGNLWRMSKL